jgi:predicted peroxiredoxin
MDGINIEQKGSCTKLHRSFGIKDMDLPEVQPKGLHTVRMFVQQIAKIGCRFMGCSDG